jgi:protein-tyrosine-phosphatase
MPDQQMERDIEDSPVRVLFLCTANICRSPLAEVMARERFGDSFRFTSAGTRAIEGYEASEHSQTVASERGLDLSRHRSTPLADCPEPDLVIGMEQHHLVAAHHQFPDLDASLIVLLDHPRAIIDPYLHSIDVYRDTAGHIERALDDLGLEGYTAGLG